MKLDFLTNKIFFQITLKDIVKRMKRQAIDWEKIFAKHVSDKGIISKNKHHL